MVMVQQGLESILTTTTWPLWQMLQQALCLDTHISYMLTVPPGTGAFCQQHTLDALY